MYLFIRTSFSSPEARDELVSSCLGHGLNHKIDKGVDVRLPVVSQLNHPHWIKDRCTVHTKTVAGNLIPTYGGYGRWGRRLESWPNTAARLAGWKWVTQQAVIFYVKDRSCRPPWRTTLLAPVWGWSTVLQNVNKTPSWATSRKAGRSSNSTLE